MSGAEDRYAVIVADPPWPQPYAGVNFGKDDHRGAAKGGSLSRRNYTMPYATLPVDAIAAMPVQKFISPDATLYLWTTNRFLRDSYAVAEAWGFSVSSTLVWKKPSTGFMGGTFLNDLEFIQFCRQGSGAPTLTKHRTRLFQWPRDTGSPRNAGGGHSAKPEAFLDLVEQLHPGPYLELFARRNRLGWTTWGDQSHEHVELSA